MSYASPRSHLEYPTESLEARVLAVLHAECARSDATLCPSCLLVLLVGAAHMPPELTRMLLSDLSARLARVHGAASALAFEALAFPERPRTLARFEALERLAAEPSGPGH